MPQTVIGLFLTLGGIIFGIGTGLIVKLITDDVSLIMTLWGRFLFSLPILFGVTYFVRGIHGYQVNAKGTLIVRIIFGMAGITFWFISMRTLPIGLATAVMLSSAIYVAMFSPILLQERVGIYRWSAAIIGLLGVCLISDAFSSSFDVTIIYAILASLSGAGLQIALRRLGKSDAPVTIASWYNFAGFIALSVLIVVMPSSWSMPGYETWLYLIALGIVGSFLQLCFTASYAYVDAVVVGTMRYLQVPLAGLVGYLYFAEVHTELQYFGAFLIVAASLVIVIREFQRKTPSADPSD
ncbi:MAG: DMT family transporter [Candidatus Puniceispirillaceae bacterium]